jgi:hypothetical protein
VISAIGRPLDRKYATNRAVLRLLPVAGLLAGAVAALSGEAGLQILGSGVAGSLCAFGGWALARELAPDDNAAAFVSMALGFVTHIVVGFLSLLLLITTILLVRIVNRTVGPRARLLDSVVVSGLTITLVYVAKMPLVGISAALSFALDAVLHNPLRRQWLFAGLCLAAVGVWFALNGAASPEWPVITRGIIVLLAAVTVLFAAVIVMTRKLNSKADVTGVCLSVSRVRAGMLIALLVALQSILLGQPGLFLAAPIWASLAGVAVTAFIMSIRWCRYVGLQV